MDARTPLRWALLALLPSACACAGTGGSVVDPPVEGALERLEPRTLGGIARLHALGDVLASSQPAPEDFEEIRASGVRTVVNLRTAEEQLDLDERALVTGLGLTYVHLPWNGVERLTDEVFARSRELLESVERPLLLHCASANRVGALWIPWRVLDGGVPLEEAVAEARTIGLKTAEYEARARDYVARQLAAGR
jgi:uncharacterized protein (TIGR01244 family)